MASLEELIEEIDQDIINQETQIEQLKFTRDELIDSYEEIVDRMMTPAFILVEEFIDNKLIELRGSDPTGQWRIVKQTDYNRQLPVWQNNPTTNVPLNQYAVSSLGNAPERHLSRFASVDASSSSWRIEEDTNFGVGSPNWVTRYDYNDVLSNEETEVIEANEEYFYGYDLIAQRPVVFDGTYGLVEKINSTNRAINILTFDKEKLVDTKTFVSRSIEKEGE